MAILRLFRGLECVDTGLTPSQYRIMKLAGAGGERSTRLAQRLAVAKPTLTATADGLVAAGYASRAAEPGDRRVVRLSLTPAGRAALDRADAAYSDWLGQLLDATGDRGTVLEALELLGSAMTEARRARKGLAAHDASLTARGTERNRPTDTERQTTTNTPPSGKAVDKAPRRATSTATGTGPGTGEGWLRRLAGYCWRYPRNVVLALGGTLVVTAVAAVVPLIQRQIVDDLVGPGHPAVWPLAVLLLGAALTSFAGLYLRRYRGGQVSLDVQHDLRTEMLGALSRLDGTRQDQLHTGQIVSRSISDLSMVQALLSMIPMLLGNAVLFVASLAIMLFLSPLLTLIALAVGPALWFISVASRRTLFPASWDAQQQAAAVAGVVDGAVTGVRVVKGFGQEDQEIRPAGMGEPAALRLAGARGAADGPVQPGPAGRSRARPGRGARAGRVAGHRGLDHPGHVRGVLLLPASAGRPGPRAGRARDHRPGSAGQRDPGVRGHRHRARRHRPARRGAARIGPGRRGPRRRQLRLRAGPARAARAVAARGGGRDRRAGRHLRVGEIDHRAAAPPLLRRDRRSAAGRRPRRP